MNFLISLKKFFFKSKKINSLDGIFHQFNESVKQKSNQQIIMEIFYKEKFTLMEIDYLKNLPNSNFLGSTKVYNNDGTVDVDFVPCSTRPDVIFCCYGKN